MAIFIFFGVVETLEAMSRLIEVVAKMLDAMSRPTKAGAKMLLASVKWIQRILNKEDDSCKVITV